MGTVIAGFHFYGGNFLSLCNQKIYFHVIFPIPTIGAGIEIQALLKNFLTFGTIFVLRKKKDYNPSYRLPLGPVMPLIAMFMTGTLIVSTFVWAPVAGLVCAVVAVVTGLPVYYMWERQNKKAA